MKIGNKKREGSHYYIWSACTDCGKGRWVRISNGKEEYTKCVSCSIKGRHHSRETKEKMSKAREGVNNYFYGKHFLREKCSQWKGGIRKSREYIRILLDSTNPYSVMADSQGYVLEHRLLMAEYLQRPLTKEEVAHHNGTRYPMGSIKDKQDNRIENLKLFKNKGEHNAYHKKLREEILV